jgi:squalene-hopene/tetraprenyl-beta-curcumene cyclase
MTVPRSRAVPSAIERGLDVLTATQDDGGSWKGDYGGPLFLVPVYVAGLELLGRPPDPATREGFITYLRGHQNADGGWGELPHSYDDPSTKGQGPSTPSQTAWALVSLFATGDRDSESVRRGVGYLLAKQQYDGSWKDDHWTATGFPKVFYLRYHLYATVFPLRALALYERQGTAAATTVGELTAGGPLRGDHGVN